MISCCLFYFSNYGFFFFKFGVMILKDHKCSLYKLYFFRILAHYGVWQVRIFPIRGSDSNIALHTYTSKNESSRQKRGQNYITGITANYAGTLEDSFVFMTKKH